MVQFFDQIISDQMKNPNFQPLVTRSIVGEFFGFSDKNLSSVYKTLIKENNYSNRKPTFRVLWISPFDNPSCLSMTYSTYSNFNDFNERLNSAQNGPFLFGNQNHKDQVSENSFSRTLAWFVINTQKKIFSWFFAKGESKSSKTWVDD